MAIVCCLHLTKKNTKLRTFWGAHQSVASASWAHLVDSTAPQKSLPVLDLDQTFTYFQNLSNYWHFIIIGQVDCNKRSHLNLFQAIIYSFHCMGFPAPVMACIVQCRSEVSKATLLRWMGWMFPRRQKTVDAMKHSTDFECHFSLCRLNDG